MCRLSRPDLVCLQTLRSRSKSERGAVLLEVVLALVLFVGAAAVLTSGLSSSLDGVDRLRRNTHAADLAVSVLSELQLGLKTVSAGGPQPFDPPMAAWTWEAVVNPIQADTDEAGPYRQVEVIIRHDESGLVYRCNQVLRMGDPAGVEGEKRPGIDSF